MVAARQTRLRLIVGDGLGPVRLLVLLALLAAGVAVWRRRATLYQVSILVSLVVLALVLTDRGAWSNHLLDPQVLTIVVLGAADRHHFGRETVDAIERNYRAGYRPGGEWIYEPRPRP
jgi:hypothetical protein